MMKQSLAGTFLAGLFALTYLSQSTYATSASYFIVTADEEKLASQDVDFFEKKIRPVLVEKCYQCHSEKSEKVRGGLVLD
ncbi:MAG TPA: hypothetical protein PKD72_10595, partial [Gemmatales bacterium]|nr:hypothetical protein [Gemmatales bacterium]